MTQNELKWYWAYTPYLDEPHKQVESAVNAGYAKIYFKSEADKVIAELEENHKTEVKERGLPNTRYELLSPSKPDGKEVHTI